MCGSHSLYFLPFCGRSSMAQCTRLDLDLIMTLIFWKPSPDREAESTTSLIARTKYVCTCTCTCIHEPTATSACTCTCTWHCSLGRVTTCVNLISTGFVYMHCEPMPHYLFQIPESFADCLGGLLSVVGQNLSLRIEAVEGTSISAVHANRPVTWTTASTRYIYTCTCTCICI